MQRPLESCGRAEPEEPTGLWARSSSSFLFKSYSGRFIALAAESKVSHKMPTEVNENMDVQYVILRV